MIDFSAPLAVMERASSQVDKIATKVSGLGFPGDTVDLSSAAVDLLQSKNDFEANTKVLQVEDQMSKSLLDIQG
jgi:flagellar hook protein FlgE